MLHISAYFGNLYIMKNCLFLLECLSKLIIGINTSQLKILIWNFIIKKLENQEVEDIMSYFFFLVTNDKHKCFKGDTR